MSSRYSLRFVSSERAGETVPIQGSPFVVGRKPGSSFQLLLKSVSGRHAEFLQEGGELRLQDLKSTNGTRVNGKRVEQTVLRGGERIAFGDVEFDLLDSSSSAPAGADAGGDTDAFDLDEIELDLGDTVRPDQVPTPAPKAPSMPTASIPAKKAPPAAPPAPPKAPAKAPAPASFELEGDLAEAPMAVSATNLERATKSGSKLPLLLLCVGLLAGGAAWWTLGRGGDEGGAVLRAVTEVPGNVLNGSFEEAGGWSAREDGSDTFRPSRSARVSGAQGLRVDLGPAGSAFHDSDVVRTPTDGSFVARASLRRSSDASVVLGVAFQASEDDSSVTPEEGAAPAPAGTTTVWCVPVAAGDAFAEVEVSGSIPRGYEFARVVVAAGGRPAAEEEDFDAWAEVDDVSLVFEGAGKPTSAVDEVRFYGLGRPVAALAIFKIDALLVSGLRLRRMDSTGPGQGIADMTLEQQAQGVRLSWSGAGPVVLSARLERQLVDTGVATLGPDGYGPRGGAFEAAEVTDVLAGSGRDLLRFDLGSPMAVTGSPSGSGMRIEVNLPAKGSLTLQTGFREEREEALNLATSARQATSRGQRGEALGLWKELLTRYPYEADAVAEADTARSTLVQSGLENLATLNVEVERARFFGLADLYRDCHQRALEIQSTYAGSEVAAAASALADALDSELRALAADGDRTELERLAAIRAGLEDRSAMSLAGAVAEYAATLAESEIENADGEIPQSASEER